MPGGENDACHSFVPEPWRAQRRLIWERRRFPGAQAMDDPKLVIAVILFGILAGLTTYMVVIHLQ
jgi:hypothetical protein